jgi:hypothetical protein
MPLKSATTRQGQKVFNNHFDFEPDLWKHQTKAFASAPQTRAAGNLII